MFYINGITQHVAFCDWHPSLRMMFSGFFVVTCVGMSFLGLICMAILHFVYPLISNGYLDCFHLSALMNNVAVMNVVCDFVSERVFSFLLGIYMGMGFLGHKIHRKNTKQDGICK